MNHIVVLFHLGLCVIFQVNGQTEAASISGTDFGTVAKLNSLNFEQETSKREIREAIGDSRVVLLGEQSHGDGTTFTAKINLIKFLNQELGFDVIAFESDLFALEIVNQEFQVGGNLFRLVDGNVYGIWTNIKEMDPLYHFISETKNSSSIAIAGFDCRHSLLNSSTYMVPEITNYLKGLSFNVNSLEFQKFSSMLANLNAKEYLTKYTQEEESFFFVELKEILQFLVENQQLDRNGFYKNLFRSIEGFAKNAWSVRFLDGKPTLQDKYGNKDGNLRDYYLAQNALYLINQQYKGHKIIFWGATYHFAKNLRLTDSLESKHNYRNTMTMADVLSASGLKYYSMGFTTYQGSFGMPWSETPRTIKPASVGSFEHWANGKGMSYAFLNLTTPGKFLMRPLGHAEMMANWSDILSGVIFIEEMHPVTPK